jgi:hypothetical protein
VKADEIFRRLVVEEWLGIEQLGEQWCRACANGREAGPPWRTGETVILESVEEEGTAPAPEPAGQGDEKPQKRHCKPAKVTVKVWLQGERTKVTVDEDAPVRQVDEAWKAEGGVREKHKQLRDGDALAEPPWHEGQTLV